MRRVWLAFLVAVLLWPHVMNAQNQIGGPTILTAQDTGACASATMCATFPLPRATAIAFQVSGTWSGTLTFQGTSDGSTYVSLFVASATTGAQATTTTANGVFTVSNPGFQAVRVVFTTRVSGSATIVLTQGYGMAIKSSPAFPGSFTIGDLLYANSATTLSGLADVATGQVLASGGVGAAPAYTATPTLAAGSLTVASTPVTISQTWNNAGVTFTGLNIDITNTASNAASLPFAITNGAGGNLFRIGTSGQAISASNGTFDTLTTNSASGGLTLNGSGNVHWSSSTFINSPTDGRLKVGSNAFTAGFILDSTTTADTLRVMNFANNADGSVQAASVSPSAVKITAGTDDTTNIVGDVVQVRYKATIAPASGGAGNCATQAAGFKANSTNADCVIATLPAGSRLVAAYADVTAGFTCSATCSGTKTFGLGISAGGVEVFASGLNVAATGTFGLADANMGTAMTRAAQIQGAYTPSWSATTTLTARFVSGTGSWGNGSVTNVNAGSITFYLITEQAK